MIRIMAPLNEDCILDSVLEKADEFYIGIADKEWMEALQTADSFNTRGNRNGFVNFHSMESLKKSLQTAAQKHKPVYLTMNAQNIDTRGLQIAQKTVEEFASAGGTGLICSDLNGLAIANKVGLEAVLSTNMPVYNIKALEYLIEHYQILRVVLPRDMTLAEIKAFRQATDLQIEVFGMNFGCKYSNAHCLGTHNHSLGGFCYATRFIDWHYCSMNGQELEPELLYQSELNHWIFGKYFLNNACGLCALFELNQLGIDSFKIVGRELAGSQIESCLELVLQCREAIKYCHNKQEFAESVKRKLGIQQQRQCQWGYQCYYPEF